MTEQPDQTPDPSEQDEQETFHSLGQIAERLHQTQRWDDPPTIDAGPWSQPSEED